ncbi:integrase catalytic domain-containing protein [Trichonephila clavipes]|nr:integrase catalytic domain-containing protein [Trichonephila clavipes]
MSDLCENLCVQKKRAKLIKEGRCFICCNTGCYVKKCKKEVCSYCKGRHARAICFKLEKSKQNSHLDLEEKNVDVKTTSSNSVFHNRGGVLLQCVEAEIIGRSSSDKIFCLFDNGSSDFYWSLTHRIKRLDSSLVAVETRLGWSLQGRCDERSDCTSVHMVHSEDESISTELRRFWEIESLGILDKGSMTLGNGDEEILSEFDKSVNFVDGRYRVNLPWKPGMREALQNNKTVARKRFEGLVRRFKCDHELFCEYKDVIDDYVREGIVERTSCDSLLDSQGFYLPHHAVIRSDKTTSHIRIVFDGSAYEDGQSSLNQSLYTGPNLHPNILELLLCFRKSPVAFTADVKSSFLQIELDFRDRDFTRFFWTDNLNKEPYVLNFTRVLFGLRPSPYLLAATLKHHFKKYREQYPYTFELLNSSIYVDDLICGQNDVPDALRTTLECLQIFSDAGMLLRKWRSNSKQLNLLWQQEGVKTESSETSAIDLRPPTKVLGLAWDPENDLIYFDLKDPLRKILGRALLTFEELSTILSEVEVIVNHRPLTYVENDPGEPEPLTPAHFLELGYGDSKYPIHFIELIDATTAKESYKKRKTYRTLLLKQLWRRWKEQYLLQLKTANHFKTPSVHKNLKLNDVVLVEGNVKSKLLWELGIIKEIFIGRDDNVRSCLVKTFKGLFKKPIQLLHPLEIVYYTCTNLFIFFRLMVGDYTLLFNLC